MEDTLRERTNNKKIIWEVLILVVMEDTLRGAEVDADGNPQLS